MKHTRVVKGDASKEYFFREGCYILELWNDPSDPDVSIARARVEPGRVTRFHRLNQTVERYVILQGNGIFRSENETTPVKDGDVVVIPVNELQAIENTGSNDLVFLAICSPRFMPENYADDNSFNQPDNNFR